MVLPRDRKELCLSFFDEQLESTPSRKGTAYKCRCNMIVHQQKGAGWTNLYNHLVGKHPKLHEEYSQLRSNAQLSMTKFIVEDKFSNVFKWLEWVIEDSLPYNFVDKPHVRDNTKLKPICSTTLLKYARLLSDQVASTLKKKLGDKFGLVLDTWYNPHSHMHYLGMFAAIPNCSSSFLLAIVPFEIDKNKTIEDLSVTHTYFGAQQIYELIEIVLNRFAKSFHNILFVTGDNCPTNKRLARILNVQFIGCAAHRFQLELQKSCQNLTDIFKKIDHLFVSLRISKAALILSFCNKDLPKRANTTR
ncbi:hypothetical protein P9112_003145 [Eukaryota sp. TZLM1-RC]